MQPSHNEAAWWLYDQREAPSPGVARAEVERMTEVELDELHDRMRAAGWE